MPDFRAQLSHNFRKQQEFAADYSPLYARLFGLVGEWLAGEDGALVDWLLAASDGRAAFDITLLLLAGLHREVLNGAPETAALAAFYPTVGGGRPFDDPELPAILRQTLLARREALTPFIQTATVQTNETGRGAAWLLPLLYTGWEAVHLVDLGASAGLNLAAEMRNFRLVFSNQFSVNSEERLDLGGGAPVQFLMQTQGEFILPPTPRRRPRIASRTGCDLKPFRLETAVAEQTLAAYVWADQPHRLQRLREGVAAFRQANQGHAPIRLHPARLPDDLPAFLNQHIPTAPDHPVVIYNTYMTIYLDDKGASFKQHIADWATAQNRPVLWLQWEPLWGGPEPLDFGWVAWTADLWRGSEHHHWLLAWNHPHGTAVQWEPGLTKWAEYWERHEPGNSHVV